VHYAGILSCNNAADKIALLRIDDPVHKQGGNQLGTSLPPCPDHNGLCPAGRELHATTAVQHVLETLLALKLPEPWARHQEVPPCLCWCAWSLRLMPPLHSKPGNPVGTNCTFVCDISTRKEMRAVHLDVTSVSTHMQDASTQSYSLLCQSKVHASQKRLCTVCLKLHHGCPCSSECCPFSNDPTCRACLCIL